MEILVGMLVGVLLMTGLVIWALAGTEAPSGPSEHWPEEKKDKANENDGW